MWEEEEENLKIPSIPELALSPEAAALFGAAHVQLLCTPRKTCSILISKQEA